MTALYLLVVSLFVAILGVLVFLLRRSQTPAPSTELLLLKQQMDHLQSNVDSSSKLVHQQLSNLTKEMGDRLQASTKMMEEANKTVGVRLDNAARVVGEVQKSLGKMEEATKQIHDVGKDIASLQDILQAPKLRGSLGELFLGDLLAQVLPQDRFELQYGFKNGEKVDAVIKSAHGLIVIDSKFPLENFVRIIQTGSEEDKKAAKKLFISDVKKHIDKISSKYILPDEGTLEFALMYIPAENVYYEIILKHEDDERDLLRYAQEKRIFPVSPNSFYAYLQTIVIGLKGLQMEEGVREVMNSIGRLKKEFTNFGDKFRLVGAHLANSRGAYEQADKILQNIGGKLETLGLEEAKELRLLEGGE